MDIETLRSFLEVATSQSFTLAAGRLNLAQSTISARIRGLEQQLGQSLFVRDRDGVYLTPAGKQFLRHASTITRSWEQARHDIGVPEGYDALLRLTAPAYLWERIISQWVPWMRIRLPGVALRLEGSFPDSAIDQLAEGLLDISILYLPRQRPGVVIETLADEPIVLVQHSLQTSPWTENYILVDWGPEFRIEHDRLFADMAKPAISTGLIFVGLRHVLSQKAAGYLPLSEVASYIENGELKFIADTPVFHRPVYLAYPSDPASSDILEIALAGLRTLGKEWPSHSVPANRDKAS